MKKYKKYIDVISDVAGEDEERIEGGAISLEKLAGQKIKEIKGFIIKRGNEFVFQIIQIYYENGFSSDVAADKYIPFLMDIPDVSKKQLELIYKEK